jgi:hypothetical protein
VQPAPAHRPCFNGCTVAGYAGLAERAGREAPRDVARAPRPTLEELTGELRVVVTGVQVLSAGVLTASIGAIPFAMLWFIRPIARMRRLEAEQRERTAEQG